MDITYLKNLSNNITISTSLGGVKTLQPMLLSDILTLESSYNKENTFPTVLREALYLSGNYSYLFDYGLNTNQNDMQIDARDLLTEFNRIITRPFYVIDVYNGNDQFLFVYLDEDQNDPMVYEAFVPPIPNQSDWIKSLQITLSQFINKGLQDVFSGYNPF